MVWLIMVTSVITELIIAKSFPKVVITLMELRTFRVSKETHKNIYIKLLKMIKNNPVSFI